MAEKQETADDIIAEMLGARTEFPFVYLMGEPDTPEVIDPKTNKIIEPRKINIRRVTVKELADRLKAALRRERGDRAKLREALEATLDLFWDIHNANRSPQSNQAYAVIRKIKAALAAPPRNCDVGTAKEQVKKWRRFCETMTTCGECPCHKSFSEVVADCFSRWAQMPYEEGGAK